MERDNPTPPTPSNPFAALIQMALGLAIGLLAGVFGAIFSGLAKAFGNGKDRGDEP